MSFLDMENQSLNVPCREAYNFICYMFDEQIKDHKRAFRAAIRRIRLSPRPGHIRMFLSARKRYIYKWACQDICMNFISLAGVIMDRGCEEASCRICRRPSTLMEMPPVWDQFRALRKALDNYFLL